MRQIQPDLWETTPDSPFPGLTTHAYLWTPPQGGNVLFYNTAGEDDLDEIERLGGVAHQYLSHQDEVSPALATFAERFAARLHVHAAEAHHAARFGEADVTFDHRHVDGNGVEVIPTPGHSPGSTCYVVPGHGGLTYLFTGDTILLGRSGRWWAGYIQPRADRDALAATLDLLATLEPDLVVSSAYSGEHGAHLLDCPWADCLAEARADLLAGAAS